MSTRPRRPGPAGRVGLTVLAWAWVVTPFLYGLSQLLLKLPALFSD